jgi:hypothetical protein
VSPSQRRDSRLAYHFEGTRPPSLCQSQAAPRLTAKAVRNPVVLAREWQATLSSGTCSSRADLARKLGVTRARVTQVLALLDVAPEVVHAIAALGDPLPRPIVTERMLRPLLKLPVDRQMAGLQAICPSTNPDSRR